MKKLLKISLSIAAIIGFIYVNNSWLQVSKYTLLMKKLPRSFDGFKVVQISDLHDASFGKNQEKLIAIVKEQKPDLIVITGDFIDSNNYKLERSLEAARGFVQIAPTYYVTGNHEYAINKVHGIQIALEKVGVHVLNNESTPFKKGNDSIQIVGINDPLSGEKTDDMLARALHQTKQNDFKLLLAHRSQYAQNYANYRIDLAYTGHEHGGQVRLPWVGGMVNHEGKFFPGHLEGVRKIGDLQQVISRGLGNSLFPVRVFNRPEIVVTTLHVQK